MNIEQIRSKYFPLTLSNGYSIKVSNEDEVYEVFKKLNLKVFGDRFGFRMPPDRLKEKKELFSLYSKLHHEYFIFVAPNGESVGWFMGEAEDVVTFYLRNMGIIPEHQGNGVYKAFAEQGAKFLMEIGYERLSSQHRVTNQKMIIQQLKIGFMIASLELTEAWGALVKLVKILPKDRRDFFIKAYGDETHLEFFDSEKK